MRNLGERSESLEVWFPIFTGYAFPGGLRETREPAELAIGEDLATWGLAQAPTLIVTFELQPAVA
jgi:hypothetical protein